jgi:nuclear receptor co-repressor 1
VPRPQQQQQQQHHHQQQQQQQQQKQLQHHQQQPYNHMAYVQPQSLPSSSASSSRLLSASTPIYNATK